MKARGMRFAIAIVVSALVLAGCGGGQTKTSRTPGERPTKSPTPPTSSPSPAAQGETQLKVTLSGSNEVPRPADTAMTGSGTVTLSSPQRNACPSLNISTPAEAEITAAHIHRGAAGANGPIVVTFEVEPKSVRPDCAMVETNLVKEITDNPSQFYVNVHTKKFPDGATRGQLTS